MAILVKVHTPEMNADAYEKVRKAANWEGDVPDGAIFHVATVDDTGLHVIDVWESAADFDAFLTGRILPALQSIGVVNPPDVSISDVHAYFKPA